MFFPALQLPIANERTNQLNTD